LGYFINWLCKYSGVNFDRMIGWIFNEILGNLLVDFPSIFSWIFPQWNTWIKSNIYRQFSADFVVSLMAFKTGLWITKNDSLLGNPNVFIGVFEKWSLKSPRKISISKKSHIGKPTELTDFSFPFPLSPRKKLPLNGETTISN
jgi:hypothetical protein